MQRGFRRAEYVLVPVFYALVVAWIYRDLWHQHGAATGLGWDTIDTHGPDLDFLSNDLSHGRFSLWNPYDKGGYPVFCDPVFDRYYPMNWPFAAWGALFGTGWWLVQLKVLAHHVIAAVMIHAFVRSRGLSIRAALVSGIGLVASAPLLTHKASNILWPMVWVPLVWMAIDWALAKPSARRGVLVGGALLLPLTAGSPPGMVYAALLILPYAGLRFVQCVRAKPDWKQLAWTLGAAFGIVMLVVAVTVIPASELVALGSRDRLGTGPHFALDGGIALAAAARGVFVRGAGPFEIYCGAGLALLAALGVVLRPRADRDAPLVLFATAVLGVILAASVTAFVLPFLVAHVPPFAMLRVPGRYKLLTAWALAAGAGYGVASVEQAWSRRGWIALGAAIVVVVLCVIVAGRPATVKDHAAWWSLVAVVIPAALIATRHRYAIHALALVVLIDAPLFTFVEPGAPVAAEVRQTHEHDASVLAKLDGVRDRWRIYDEFVLGERAGARLQVRDFRGYPAVDPISLHRYAEVLDFAKKDAQILSDFNVRYVLSRPHFRYGMTAMFPRFPSPGFTAHDGFIFEADHPAPLIAWYGAITVATDHVLEAVRAAQQPDGTRTYAVVESPLPSTSGFREGTLESYAPDAISFSIDAPADGLVVLNEVMFPGWRVEVDHVQATPITANYLLRGVWVTRGQHEVTWRFDPPHWRLLVIGYLLAVLAILFAAFTIRRARDT